DRKLAGVCAGIARHFGIDVKYVRIAFVLLTVLGGIGVALYGLAYLTMTSPEAEELADPTAVLHEAGASWREGVGAGVIAAAVAPGSTPMRRPRPRRCTASSCAQRGRSRTATASRSKSSASATGRSTPTRLRLRPRRARRSSTRRSSPAPAGSTSTRRRRTS